MEDSSDLSDEYQSLHQSSYADLSEESLLESEDWLSLSTESEDSVFSSDAWLPSVLGLDVLVEHYKVVGGQHVWLDLDLNGSDTNELIWDFFSKHTLSGPLSTP